MDEPDFIVIGKALKDYMYMKSSSVATRTV